MPSVESGEILGAITCANEIMRHNKVENGKITLGCDNEGATKALHDHREYNSQWNEKRYEDRQAAGNLNMLRVTRMIK